MTDITERLRKPSVNIAMNVDIRIEAAALIELLRSDLEMLCSGQGDVQWDEVQWIIYDEWHKASGNRNETGE